MTVAQQSAREKTNKIPALLEIMKNLALSVSWRSIRSITKDKWHRWF